ncbi:MAG: RNA polymerase sigma factor [Salinivirgaceae bacterium]|nr:RNA polymerase sigma factor [Salinivirgaceae bacterium]
MEQTIALQDRLIAKCKKGDSKAQYQLYMLYVDAMYNVAYRFMQSKFDAEDALQEAFVKAFQKISSFKGESTFGAWLKRIVVNHCLSEIRKCKITFKDIDEIPNKDIFEDDVRIEDETPIEIVKKAIDELPQGARMVFTLKAIEEYKFSEISEMLALSESNCKVQYHRSKKLLREKLRNTINN